MFVISHKDTTNQLVKRKKVVVVYVSFPIPLFRITQCIKIVCMCGCTRRAHSASHKDMQHIKEEKRSGLK